MDNSFRLSLSLPPPNPPTVQCARKGGIPEPLTVKVLETNVGTKRTLSEITVSTPSMKPFYSNEAYYYPARWEGNELASGKMRKEGLTYIGEFKNLQPHGCGTVETKDGKFEGIFNEGQLEGKVTFTARTGVVYTGELKDYHWVGTVKVVYSENTSYMGELSRASGRNFDKEGYGVLETPLARYDGAWKNDKFCKGTIRYFEHPEFLEYTGEYANEAFNGEGTLKLRNGRVISGDFENGVCPFGGISWKNEDGAGSYYGPLKGFKIRRKETKKPQSGMGVWKDSKGNKYEGEWINGDLPKGKFTSKDRKATYEGEFKNFKFHGKGIYTRPNRKYNGDFVNGKYHGRGTLENEGLDSYTGEFVEGIKEGKGELIYKCFHFTKDLGINMEDRLVGTFRAGKIWNGFGFSRLSDTSNFMFGEYREGKLYNGVGYKVSDAKLFIGPIVNGKKGRGEYIPIVTTLGELKLPGTLEILKKYVSTLGFTR